MKRLSKFPSTAFYALSALMTLMTVVSLIMAFAWINRPFAGFLVYDFPYIPAVGSRDWPGAEAGLKVLDRIVSADGQTITKGSDLVNLVRDKAPGTPIVYVVESKGAKRVMTVPVMEFTIKDFVLVFIFPFLAGVAVYVLGFVVYTLKPNMPSSWVFFVFCFALGTYMATAFEIHSSYVFVHLHYAIIPLVAASLFHIGLVFPDKKRVLLAHPYLEYVIYLPALAIAVGYQLFLFNYQNENMAAWIPHVRLVTPVNRVFTLLCLVGLVILLIHSLLRARSSAARVRARMVLLGMTAAFLPSVVIQAVTIFIKTNIPWNFLVIFVIIFPASIAYSIVRHNLFDADAIIKRTVGYVVVTAIVVGIYAMVSVGVNVFLGKYQVSQSKAFPILFTLGVVLIFNPLRDKVQALVDRVFFRKEYDYGGILDRIGGAMTSLLDLSSILKRLVTTFVEDMFINTGSIMLLNSAGTGFQVLMAGGEAKADVETAEVQSDHALIQITERRKRELTKYDVLEDPSYREVSKECASDFERLRASLVVPLLYQDRVIGLFCLGEKKSGKAFKEEDIELLRTVAHQGAIAIENARLFQENLEKQRMEEELSIARDLQMSMLPASCPQLERFQIAAHSMPAREVGGDFYDFIEMGQNRIGMVIGDVTGKSVSGALVMSSSRSVFRLLAEERLSVSDVMGRANRRIKRDVKSGMFVALLHAVLDGDEGSLSLSSAGQTQPIHFSAATGKASLVETAGDNFPLGILDEAEYVETRVTFSRGDRILLYTDGIVEAMNGNQEMFGFDRLLCAVEKSESISADDFLKEILSQVNAFVGGAAQHDDLTAIAIFANH